MDSHYKPTLPRPVHLPGVLGARGHLRSTKTDREVSRDWGYQEVGWECSIGLPAH